MSELRGYLNLNAFLNGFRFEQLDQGDFAGGQTTPLFYGLKSRVKTLLGHKTCLYKPGAH